MQIFMGFLVTAVFAGASAASAKIRPARGFAHAQAALCNICMVGGRAGDYPAGIIQRTGLVWISGGCRIS
jgi:hypothetical protein